MTKRQAVRSKGFGLVPTLGTLAVTGILAAAAASAMKTLLRDSVYQERLIQAQSIAESGADDALAQLSADATWRSGFRKVCLGGSYDVTVSSGPFPVVTSTGWSKPVAAFGAAHRTVKLQARTLPIPQMLYAAASDQTLSIVGLSSIDSYDSQLDLNPPAFGSAGSVWSNKDLLASITATGYSAFPSSPGIGAGIVGRFGAFSRLRNRMSAARSVSTATVFGVLGDASYMTGGAPPQGAVKGKVSKSEQPLVLTPEDGSAFTDVNDNLAGLAPLSHYDAAKKTFTIPADSTGTIRSGVYYLNGLVVSGVLLTDYTNGPIVIYLNGSLIVYGMVRNGSRIPSNLIVYGLGKGGVWTLSSPEPIHAVLDAPTWDVSESGTLFGAIEGRRVFLTNTALHYDVSLRRPRSYATSILPKSWTVGFARQ
jgi:hypothetical protein